MMREQSVCTAGLAPCVGAQPAITIACAWCGIMPLMNLMSASVYGYRALSAWACAIAAASLGSADGACATRPLVPAHSAMSAASTADDGCDALIVVSLSQRKL